MVEIAFQRFGIDLPEYVKEKIRVRVFPPKTVLALAGNNVISVDFLLHGEIHIVNSFSDGKEFGYTNEQNLTLLGDIEYFSGIKQYASSVIAKTRVTLIELEFETFQRWFDQDKVFRDFIVAHIARKGYKMAAKFGLAKYEDSRYRLIKTLLDNLPIKPDKNGVFTLNYSHFELAFMTGMSERSVNRVLQKLKSNHLIALERKKILIKQDDLTALENLLDEISQ